MIEFLEHKQKEVYFDILDDKSRFYSKIVKLTYASGKKFVVSPYFMGGIETSLVEDLGVYVKGHVSYQPYYDFWHYMINSPELIVKGIDFFLKDIGTHNLDFLQGQVNSHFDPLYRGTLCYVLNKITEDGTITYGEIDKSFARFNKSSLEKITNFSYNGQFSVDILNWKLLESNNEKSLLLMLPNEIARGLADTGNNSEEKNIMNFGKLRKYSTNSKNKVIAACEVRRNILSPLQNKFDVLEIYEKEDKVGVIAHNV
jgi:hypothetical protein